MLPTFPQVDQIPEIVPLELLFVHAPTVPTKQGKSTLYIAPIEPKSRQNGTSRLERSDEKSPISPTKTKRIDCKVNEIASTFFLGKASPIAPVPSWHNA